MPSLEETWEEATSGLDRDVCDNWYTKLQEAYSEEKRTYHNLDYLRDKLKSFYEVKDNLKNPQTVLLAIFFQNMEYDARYGLGDKNVKHFLAFAKEAGIPEDGELLEKTCNLLVQAVLNLKKAHTILEAYGVEDDDYLLDFDVVALGSSPEEYAEYREKVRGEYSFFSEPMYTAFRLKVLQTFLQIPNIFATAEFRGKYEEQARKNIQAEIDMLS